MRLRCSLRLRSSLKRACPGTSASSVLFGLPPCRPPVRSRTSRRVGGWSPGLHLHRLLAREPKGLTGCWVILFERAVAWTPPTPRMARLNASKGTAFHGQDCLSIGMTTISGLNAIGSLARLPTHQRRRYRRRCKTNYRPAGYALAGRGLHPLDDTTNFAPTSSAFPSFQHFLFASSGSPGRSPARGPLGAVLGDFHHTALPRSGPHGAIAQIWTQILGVGSGKVLSKSLNRCQLRRFRWLRRQSHLCQTRSALSTRQLNARRLPLIPK